VLKRIFKATLSRFGIDLLLDKTVFRKVSKTPWYQGDGAALMILLSVQLVTGAVLSLSYSNSTDTAYESVLYITQEQHLGWFVRGLHYWSAGLMVLMLVFHVLRLILVGGYKAPREGTWMTGVVLFALVMMLAYSGYILRWDERAIYGLKVLLNILYEVPLIGEHLVAFVQGGTEVGAQTLTRFYSVHVILAPGLLLGLVAYHLYLVILHGPTSRIERRILVRSAKEQKKLYDLAKHSEVEGEEFFPMTMAATGAMGFVLFLVGVGLTVFVGPPELMPEANLTSTSYPAEEWWFWWYSSAIALLPPKAAGAFMLLFPVALFGFLVLLPLVDRGPRRGISNRPEWVVLVGLATMTLMVLSALRLRSPWTAWPSDRLPEFPKEHVITPELLKGREAFVAKGCNSCHAVAGDGPGMAPDITKTRKIYSRQEIEDFIINTPEGIAMPNYRGRISAEELKYVTEFVFVLQIQPKKR
jgi:ubiquinol-cytochrome c reductase cytochrome b subunit